MNTKYLKYNALIYFFGLFKIPLVLFIAPRVVEISPKRFVLKVPLGYRTKNHLNSMYFGALGIGAELSIAAACAMTIHESKQKIDFVFKDYKAEYLKRADGDVLFVCDQIEDVVNLVEQSKSTPERIEKLLKGYAYVPSKSEEPVMTYELTLSVRNRSIKV